YAKIEGKPMLALVHGNIGLQHASMAIYNAYADRVPVLIIAGNWRDAGTRNNGVNSYHSAQDMALIVRDYVKWDDEPPSPPAGETGAVREAARLLVAADNPRINAGRAARTPNGLALLVELAELLQA